MIKFIAVDIETSSTPVCDRVFIVIDAIESMHPVDEETTGIRTKSGQYYVVNHLIQEILNALTKAKQSNEITTLVVNEI